MDNKERTYKPATRKNVIACLKHSTGGGHLWEKYGRSHFYFDEEEILKLFNAFHVPPNVRDYHMAALALHNADANIDYLDDMAIIQMVVKNLYIDLTPMKIEGNNAVNGCFYDIIMNVIKTEYEFHVWSEIDGRRLYWLRKEIDTILHDYDTRRELGYD